MLLHGRNAAKLDEVQSSLTSLSPGAQTEIYVADLSRMSDVESLAKAISEKHDRLDVVINKAGVLIAPNPVTADGLASVVGFVETFCFTPRRWRTRRSISRRRC